MKVSFITDEMTQDFHEAVSFAVSKGLQGLELRSVEDTPIDRISAETAKAWKRELDAHGLRVSNLSSTFYKCRMQDLQQLGQEMEKLRRLCDVADLLDCATIRGFSFFQSGSFVEMLPSLVQAFDEPIGLLRERGKTLLLEADPSVHTTNHAQLARLLCALQEAYGDPLAIGAIFDPGNDLYDPLGEKPFPDGYAAVRGWISHVHIKDAIHTPDGPACVKIGTGEVDYPALLRALQNDGYTGWLSLETHYRAGAALNEDQMRTPQGSAFSQGGRQAMDESADALLHMLRAIGTR